MKSTLEPIYRPLMEAPTIELTHCAVCGRTAPLNAHHIVWRGWGNLDVETGRRAKPTVTLCGIGSNLYDADGRMLCHGKAHQLMLHFRYDRGRLEYLETDEPTEYARALDMDGWQEIETEDGWPIC